MRCRPHVVALGLILSACGGGGPAAPTAPPAPTIPQMLGGWGGTQADTWVGVDDGSITGGRSCNETWLITSQLGNTFSGVFQRAPGNSDVCARSGEISGNVNADGNFSVSYSGTGVSGGCPIVSGDTLYRGVVSASGNITAGRVIVIRCPSGRGTADLRYTQSLTLTRR